jgi:putative addiction module component (TIGR02574 family)
MNIEELKQMSLSERIRTMEVLWDSLIEDESEIESPDWHREVLEDRKRKIEAGEATFISLDKLRASRKS